MPDNNIAKLRRLYQFGQSPWYDNIDRRLIENGELKSLFDMGIVGVTSNPSIFEKSINGSDIYDTKIKKFVKEGMSVDAIYDALTADDVRDAADLLKDVYEQSKYIDGYVSIEVLPQYANDPFKTLEYARHIFKKVDRKNIMIKVPGTKESPGVIRTLIAEGINVNVTLLFSVAQYEAIAVAYIDGLEERVRAGTDLKSIACVASVFISRIDSKIDNILNSFSLRETDISARNDINLLKGKIAIANAKLIYQKFKDLFGGKFFSELKARGAQVQRPLWASTSTKNPAYSDCMYVDGLIGPFTVNTMPHQTVFSFTDHGRVALTLERDLTEARVCLEKIEKLGINLETVCSDAQKEGLLAFQSSFDTLMASIKSKMV